MKMYDFLIVGAGLFGSVFAQQAKSRGRTCLVVDKRMHIGGNCFTDNVEGIDVHRYGPHIFHTSDESVWKYINNFTKFNRFVNRPKVRAQGRLFSFPINLNTLNQLWGVETPAEAQEKLESVRIPINGEPRNLEEYALSQIGKELYELFIEGYTTKQWNKHPSTLPASILKRIPIRLTWNDDYYNDTYQGIPLHGYTQAFEHMLNGCNVLTGVNYVKERRLLNRLAMHTVYTGPLDEFFDYCLGKLQYRGLRFSTDVLNVSDHQGNAIINYTDASIPHTRIVEHKHFNLVNTSKTVVTTEFPDDYEPGKVPYYPINDAKNNELRDEYLKMTPNNVTFGGRLATYRYMDMDKVIASALNAWIRFE